MNNHSTNNTVGNNPNSTPTVTPQPVSANNTPTPPPHQKRQGGYSNNTSNYNNNYKNKYNKHHQNDPQVPQQQHNPYMAAAYYQYPPQMMYGGYPVQGLPMQGVPMQYYIPQAYNPAGTSAQGLPQQASSPVPANPALSGGSTPLSNKVKITTRDGEKITFSPSSGAASMKSPVSQHVSLQSPVPAPVVVTSSPAPIAAPIAPQPVKKETENAAIDEFKKRILERAQKVAQQKKEAEQLKKEAELKAKSPTPVVEAPKVEVPEVKETPKEEPIPEVKEITPEVKEAIPEVKEITPEVKEITPEVKEITPEVKEETPEVKEVTPDVKEEAPEVKEAPKEESTPEVTQDVEEPKPETVEEVEETVEEPKEIIPTEAQEEAPKEVSEETVEANETVEDVTGEIEEQIDTIVEEPGFTISKYFEQIAKAEKITDPSVHVYPSPVNGPDPKLKETSTKAFRYDPLFLYQFAAITQFPIDLEWKEKMEKLIIIPDSRGKPQGGNDRSFSKNNSQRAPQQRLSSTNLRGQQFDMGSRQNSRQGSKRRGGGAAGGRDRSSRKGNSSKRDPRNRDNDQEGEAEPPVEVKPLEVSANRWVPRSRAKKEETNKAPDGTDLLNTEEIERKVKSLLNKLTLEYFEEISGEIIKVANQSKWEEDAKSVKQVVELTFAKACDEPFWSSMYAQFCLAFCKNIDDEIKDNTLLDKSGVAVSGGVLVRRCLLSRCQVEYEKGWTDKLPTNEDGTPIEPEMMSDEYYKAAAAKRRGLGLVKFIGELYTLRLLSDQVIFVCLEGQSKNTVDPSEDTLENLCQLVTTVGKQLDTSSNERAKVVLNKTFERIETIIKTVKINSRIRFMLMDLQDLRKNRWASENDNKGPKTLSEISEEADRKRMEDERAQQERRRRPNDSGQNSSRQNSSWGSQNRVSQNDIKNVGVLRNSDRSLGPMNNFNRSRSTRNNNSNNNNNNNNNNNQQNTSSTNLNSLQGTSSANSSNLPTRENSKRPAAEMQTAANRFAALMGDDEEKHEVEAEVEAEQEEEEEETESEAQEEQAAQEAEPENEETVAQE